jgi:hypothetical protein
MNSEGAKADSSHDASAEALHVRIAIDGGIYPRLKRS